MILQTGWQSACKRSRSAPASPASGRLSTPRMLSRPTWRTVANSVNARMCTVPMDSNGIRSRDGN
eukprot:5148864-Lingulodinium_polyedra.AAC.1